VLIVNDGALDSAPVTVSITVNDIVNLAPVFVSAPITEQSLGATYLSSAPVSLEGWEITRYDGRDPDSDWVVSDSGFSVTQRFNANPSMYLHPDEEAPGVIRGSFETRDAQRDDDYMGFVFGYQNPSQFYLLDWKGATQGVANIGITLKRYDVPEGVRPEFWNSDIGDSSHRCVYLC